MSKDLSNEIRDRLYTGGFDTVAKNLTLIKEGKATADDETIMFTLERLAARKYANMPDMSGVIGGKKREFPAEVLDISEKLDKDVKDANLWELYRALYDIADGRYKATRPSIQAAYDKAASLQYSCLLPTKTVLLPKDVADDIRSALYTGQWSKVETEMKNILAKQAVCDEDTLLFALERLQAAKWQTTPDMSSVTRGASRRLPSGDISHVLREGVEQAKLWTLYPALWDIAAGHASAERDAVESAYTKAASLQYSCLLPQKTVLLSKNATKDIQDHLYTGQWSSIDNEFKEVLEKKATCDEETILFCLERMKEHKWDATPNMSSIVGGKQRSHPATVEDVSQKLLGAVKAENLWDIYKMLYDIVAKKLTASREAVQAGYEAAQRLKYSIMLPEKAVLLPPDVSEEIQDWLYTGGWDHVTQLLNNIRMRKADADEETILIALERMKEADWKAIPDMSSIIGNKTRKHPAKADVTAQVKAAVDNAALWDLNKLLYDIAALRITCDHAVIKTGVEKANSLKYNHYLPSMSAATAPPGAPSKPSYTPATTSAPSAESVAAASAPTHTSTSSSSSSSSSTPAPAPAQPKNTNYVRPAGPGVEDEENFLAESARDGSNRYITMVFKKIIDGTSTAQIGTILEAIETLKKNRMTVPDEIYSVLPGYSKPKNMPKNVDGELNTDCDDGSNRYITQTLTRIANGEESAKKSTIRKAVATLQKNRITVPNLKGLLDGPEGENDLVTGGESEPASKEDQIAELEKKIQKYQAELDSAKATYARVSKSSNMATAAKAELNKIEKLEKNIKECRDKIRWAK